PTRNRFSLGYRRLFEAMAKGRLVGWGIAVYPDAPNENVAEAFAHTMGWFEFSGLIQCFLEGGGWLDVQVADSGVEIASIEQIARDGLVSLNVGDGWVSVGADEGYELSMLTTGILGELFFAFDYASIRQGTVPLMTAVTNSGMRLWELASPWSEDNNYLQVSQGSTSHGTSYNIDTAGFRSILSDWAESIPRDIFSFTVPNTDRMVGMRGDVIEAFIGRVKQLASSAELSQRLKINLAFGEGDFLQRARGSGTIRTSGGSKGISYDYTASLTDRKLTSRQRINFQPAGAPDTIVLDVRRSSSSNGKDAAADSVSASVRGLFDDKPYSFEYKADMNNRYSVQDGLLTETITGSASCSLSYDGRPIFDMLLTRDGATNSYAAQNFLHIEDSYHADVAADGVTLFSGVIALSFHMDEQPSQAPEDIDVRSIELMDFMEIEAFRGTLDRMLDGIWEIFAAIPWRSSIDG
ncbi:MAG: hypothetical protein FWG37_02490, partial [Clostridia bacterium]|nr:hypothetical protein [Clostridia bacterium]